MKTGLLNWRLLRRDARVMLMLLGVLPAVGWGDKTVAETDQLSLPMAQWRLVTDGVMGGVSQGRLQPARQGDRECLRLSGDVRTENNGGFVQMALDLSAESALQAESFDGIRLWVAGNDENYNVHLRTADLWLPWQSYRAGFLATPDWQVIELPFDAFTAYKTGSAFRVDRLRRIGIVAIGRAFHADLCVAGVSFYRSVD
jgi:hypothetical protein